jgi:acylglycerol lipase
MTHFEFTWQSRPDSQTFFQGWAPDGSPEAVVCLVHGLGEHSSRYTHVARYLNAAGFAVLSFDLYGHGRSQGKRGHAPSMEVFLAGIDQLLLEAAQRYPGKPCFLYGHSLGGILVLYYTLQRKPKLNGVIATSSGLRTSLEQQKFKIAMARGLAKIVPASDLPSGLNAADISHDPQVVKTYQADPLVHDRITFGMASNLLDAITWTFEHAPEFQPPLLLVHGTADNIAYSTGSQEFARLVPGDCTLKLWDGLAHETHNEPEKEQVLAYNVEWIKSKL